MKQYDFEWSHYQAVKDIREDISQRIRSDKKWNLREDSPLELKQLCFSSPSCNDGVWRFQIYDLTQEKHVGYGAVEKNTSSKVPFRDYLFLVLSDGLTVEAWTYNKDKSRTDICVNGQILGYIKSHWNKFLFECLSWQSKWDFFWENQHIGSVGRGDYLFGNKVYCKDLVKPDTLKLVCENGNNISIILAHDPGTASGFLLLPLKLLAAVTTRARFDNPDFVVPNGESLKNDQDVLFGFLLNIIFREVYFDMAYPGNES